MPEGEPVGASHTRSRTGRQVRAVLFQQHSIRGSVDFGANVW